MSIGDTFEDGLLALIFTATDLALIADDTVTTPLTNLFYALHTADPLDAGTQTTSEIAYTSYGRATVARSGAGHTVASGSVSPDANVDFAAGTGGAGTATYFSVGSLLTTGGVIYFSGTVTPNVVTGDGITPRLTTATAITLD